MNEAIGHGRTAPILRGVERERREVSTAVGLTLSGQNYQLHFKGNVKSAQVIEALKHLQCHIGGRFILIWNWASIDTRHQTEVYLAAHPEITLEPLPPYAPDFNPEENCHRNVKQQLENVTPDTAAEECRILDRGFARLRRRRGMLPLFTRHADLTVKQLW